MDLFNNLETAQYIPIPIQDGEALLVDHFLTSAEAERLFLHLRKQVTWRRQIIKIYGKEHPVPRESAWFGDPESKYFTSGFIRNISPSMPELLDLKNRIEKAFPDLQFNSVLLNWSSLDAAYNFAQNNHIPFKLHTLIWGAQQPSWIGGLDSASQRKEIEEWFMALADRYDSVAYIDVVNEPINNAPNGMTPWGASVPNVNYAKALGGAGITGWDWVITAFRLARKYFPHAKLIMNEYNVINNNTATQNYIKIINLLKSDTLIDGIGEQAHAFTTSGVSSAILKNNLDLLAGTGIPIYLTEMDIDGLSDPVQLREYQRVFPLFWNHAAVKGITLWGFRTGCGGMHRVLT